MAAATVVLDLDGTVWDSRPWYAKTIAQLSEGSALKVKRALEAGTSIVQAAKDYGVSKTRLVRAAKEDGASVELYEGVLPTLDSLRERGTLIGIVTNLPGWLACPLLESTGIGKYAVAVATPRRGVPAKPKPHGIRRVLAKMEQNADFRTWFVGDGTVDAEAAMAASVRFAWASFGYETEEPSGANKVLASFQDVLDL